AALTNPTRQLVTADPWHSEVVRELALDVDVGRADGPDQIDGLGDDITAENATAALDAVSRIATSAQAVYTELDTACS
ncbi:MAG: hypothetical protein ACERLM_04555, partial [Acidimicrobiales bacterium]